MKAFALLAFLLAVSAHADWERRSFSGLSYWLYSPASGGSANALMLNLHGCNQKADDLKQLGNWESTAEKFHMLVAIPDVPKGGVILGCWNYYGQNQTESNNDNGPLIALTEHLAEDPTLHIDPRHVYVSGLSSGATQALLLGCLRPDLFSGIASNSGPALGSSIEEIGHPTTTAEEAARFCLKLAGSRSSYFRAQKAVILRGDIDYVVNPAHAEVNAQALASVYGATSTHELDLGTFPGSNSAGTATLFLDSEGAIRAALLINKGLQHNWAAGNQRGGQPSHYINPNSIDFPNFLSNFFTANAPNQAL